MFTLNRLKHWTNFWLVPLLLLAFFLRLYALADVGIDNDEIYEYNRWIKESFQVIVAGDLILNSQPLAYLFSRASILLHGDTLFSLRWPSACLSLLAVVFMYKIARLLFDRRVAWVSALLLAVSPYAIFLAHTLRGYSGVLALSLLVYLLGLLAWRSGSRRYWLALTAAAAAMLYTHLFSALALVNLAVLLSVLALNRVGATPAGQLFRGRRVQATAWLATSLVLLVLLVLVLYAPLWSKLVQQPAGGVEASSLDTVAWVQRPQVPASVWNNMKWFSGLEKGSLKEYTAPVFLGLVLLGAGLGWAWQSRRRSLLFVLGWAWLPFVEVWLAGQVLDQFWARPSYLVFALPPLFMLVALFIAQLPACWHSRRLLWGVGSLLTVLLALLWTLTVVEYFTVFTNGNWLAVGNFLHRNVTPLDLVVCQPYAHAWRDVDVDAEDICTRTLNYRRYAGTETVAPVTISYALVYGTLPEANPGVVNRQGRVWVVAWDVPESVQLASAPGLSVTGFNRFGRSYVLLADGQPTFVANLAQALVALRATTTGSELQYTYSLMIAPLAAAGGQEELARDALAVARRHLPHHPDSAAKLAQTEQLAQSLTGRAVEHPLQANFSDQIMLQGYTLNPDRLTPGANLRLTLFWQALQQVQENYWVFLHVRDGLGRTVAQFDYQPYDGGYPTRHWQPGQLLTDSHEFPVPADFPSGEYRLMIGFYNPETLARLPLLNDQSGENALFLSPLVVQ